MFCDNYLPMIGLGAIFFVLSFLIFGLWLKKSPDEITYDMATADNGHLFKGRPLLAKITGFVNYLAIILLVGGVVFWFLCLFD